MDEPTKRRLLEMAAKYNFFLLLIGVSLHPLLLPTDWSFLPVAILGLLFYGAVYYLIRRGRVKKMASPLLFFSTFFLMLPLLILSGGIHSHLIYVLPLAPVFASLVLSERASWMVALLTALTAISLGVIIPPPGEALALQEALPNLVWLILAIFLGAGFARFFASENRALANALKHQAHIDYLTGVLNRRGMEERLQKEAELAKAYDRSLAIFMVDLDYFKQFNDFNGHLEGDKCLQQVSQCLDGIVRGQGGFMGRYGGEEFIIVLADTDLDFSQSFAHVLREAVKGMGISLKRGQPRRLTASVGYCFREAENINEINHMVSRADTKLYQCKAEGRDSVLGDVLQIQSVEFKGDIQGLVG